MGFWAKADFGIPDLPTRAVIFGGSNPLEVEDAVVRMFDRVLQKRHAGYHTYVVAKGRRKYALIFQVYGPSMAVDGLHILHDGGCEEMLFVGYAWCSAKAARIGDYIVPSRVLLLDGFTNVLAPRSRWAKADTSAQSQIDWALARAQGTVHRGVTVSVPSVFRRPRGYSATLARVAGIAHEMELGPLLHFSKVLGIRGGGALIVSDTPHNTLYGDSSRDRRSQALVTLIAALIGGPKNDSA